MNIILVNVITYLMVITSIFGLITLSTIFGLFLFLYFNKFVTKWNQSKAEPVLISIEGNIGVGKSTLLNTIKQHFSKKNIVCEFIQEPVDIWEETCDENGVSILETFYTYTHRWAYTFQNFAFVTRLNRLLDTYNKIKKIETTNKKYIISDRSLDADRMIFGKIMHDDGYMNELEWSVYMHYGTMWKNIRRDVFAKNPNNHTLNIIYLRCDPEVAYERITKRGRDAESKITLEYLKQIHDYSEKWINKSKRDNNVLIIDANNDFVNNKEQSERVLREIDLYLSKF